MKSTAGVGPVIAIALLIVGCGTPAAPVSPAATTSIPSGATVASGTPAQAGSLQRKVAIDGLDIACDLIRRDDPVGQPLENFHLLRRHLSLILLLFHKRTRQRPSCPPGQPSTC